MATGVKRKRTPDSKYACMHDLMRELGLAVPKLSDTVTISTETQQEAVTKNLGMNQNRNNRVVRFGDVLERVLMDPKKHYLVVNWMTARLSPDDACGGFFEASCGDALFPRTWLQCIEMQLFLMALDVHCVLRFFFQGEKHVRLLERVASDLDSLIGWRVTVDERLTFVIRGWRNAAIKYAKVLLLRASVLDVVADKRPLVVPRLTVEHAKVGGRLLDLVDAMSRVLLTREEDLRGERPVSRVLAFKWTWRKVLEDVVYKDALPLAWRLLEELRASEEHVVYRRLKFLVERWHACMLTLVHTHAKRESAMALREANVAVDELWCIKGEVMALRAPSVRYLQQFA